MLTVYLLILLSISGLAENHLRADFVAFHNGAGMALSGQAALAYDWEALRPLQAATLGMPEDAAMEFLGWVYPPHFFFAVLPFGLLPFGWAWFAWILATGLLMAWAVRSVFPEAGPPAVLLALCTPGVLICAAVGQNSLLTAALLGFTYALLDRRPVAAGIALGLMTYKPQFGLIAPALLALTGRWRTFAAATATALVAGLLALLAFGPDAWVGFVRNLGLNNDRYLTDPEGGVGRMQSFYVLALLFGGRTDLAWVAHGLFATGVAATVLRLWLRRPEGPPEARAAAAIAAAFLMTPFVWLYDSPALAVAALFLARAAMREGWLPWEFPLLAFACLWVGAVFVTGPLPIYALTSWLILLACAWRRDRAWRLSQARCATTS